MERGNPSHKHALVALALASLTIFFVVLFGFGSDYVAEHYAAKDRSQNYQGSNEDISAVLSALREFDPLDDTIAQWVMAFVSIAGTIIAVVTLIYLRFTLMETRRVGQAQVRAYLSCENFSVEVYSGWVWFYPIIKNTGQSPAETTRFSAYMDVSVTGSKGRNKSRDNDGDGPYIAAGEAGKMYIAWSKREMPEAAFINLQNGEASFEIFCRLYCMDVFGVERKTTFLISVGKDEGSSGSRRAIYKKGTIDHLTPGVYDD